MFSQPAGFEPARGIPIGFQVQRLNHSATTALNFQEYIFIALKRDGRLSAVVKMWNASRFCVSSLRRGHANLLCIVPILVYVLPKQVQLKRQKKAFYFSVSAFFVDVVRLKSKYKHPSHTRVEPRTRDWKSTMLSSALLELLVLRGEKETTSMPVLMPWSWVRIPRECFHLFDFPLPAYQLEQCGAKNVERFTILRVILAQGPC